MLVRVPPPMPGLPRPRFSLYLSAQLQIGVIRVYSQQCQYLVGKVGAPKGRTELGPMKARLQASTAFSSICTEDIQHVLERLHRVQRQILIDMVEPDV